MLICEQNKKYGDTNKLFSLVQKIMFFMCFFFFFFPLSLSSFLDCLAINAMIDPDGTLDALSNLGFASPILPAQPKQKSSPISQNTRPQVQPNCQPEAQAPRPAAVPVAAEFETTESESDFSIHFNRFNPDGEEDATLRE